MSLGKTWQLWLLIPALALGAGWIALSLIHEGRRPPQEAVDLLDQIARTGRWQIEKTKERDAWRTTTFEVNGLCTYLRREFKGGWALKARIYENEEGVVSASLVPSDNDYFFPPWYKQAWWRAQRLVPSLPAFPF
jgi:hypothetical protein